MVYGLLILRDYMRKMIVLSIILLLFIFGCSSQAPAKTTQEKTVNQKNERAENDVPPSLPSEASSLATKVENKGYAALIALGVPLECDVTLHDAKIQGTMKLYIKGKKFRAQSELPESTQCKKSITLFTDQTLYSSCEGSQIMPGCQWIRFSLSEEQVQTSANSVSPTALQKIPNTDFSCKPGLFGDEKFSVGSEKVCDLTELVKQIQNNYQNNPQNSNPSTESDTVPPLPQ